MLRDGIYGDAFDEQVRLSESTIIESVKRIAEAVVDVPILTVCTQ